MGMCDELRIETPDGHVPSDGVWQTKDLDCDLDRYEVRDGKLYRVASWGEPREPELVQHTGVIWFYDYIEGKGLLSWYAEFREGALIEVLSEAEVEARSRGAIDD